MKTLGALISGQSKYLGPIAESGYAFEVSLGYARSGALMNYS